MTPEDRFWWFLNERHAIWTRRNAGAPKPWTDDPILQQYKFTNVFRELDKTTIWCDENIRKPLANDPELLLFNVALFRQTGAAEGWQGIVRKFDAEKHAAKYVAAQVRGLKTFTAAYMVTGMFPGAKGNNKVVSLFKYALQPVWDDRKKLVKLCQETKSLQALTEALSKYIGWGGNHFMAYEVACDLLYTPLLRGAIDQHTWANPGPGAQRGLSRLYGGKVDNGRGASSRPKAQCVEEMQGLLAQAPKRASKQVLNFTFRGLPAKMFLDMRMCEGWCCEFDKIERVRNGEGRPRSKYSGLV